MVIIITIIIIFHLVLFGFMFYLYYQLQSLKKANNEDITQLMGTYLDEIKYENERLQLQLKASPHNQEKQAKNSSIQFPPPPTQQVTHHEQEETVGKWTEHIEREDKAETPSIESQVLQLHEQGLSTEDIAKQLGCGKTEVALIINFHTERKA